MKVETELSHPLSSIVQDTRNALINRLSAGIALLILYGSEARGEASPDSDVDMMIVIRQDDPRIKDAVRDVVYDIMWRRDFDRLVSLYVLPLDQYEAQRRQGFSFIRSVQREGVVLWQAA